MKAWLTLLQARIDGLSLRERVFLFVASITGVLALCYSLWFSPAMVQWKQLQQRFGAQTTELNMLQNELKTGNQPNTETLALRQELDSLQQRIDAVNLDIQAGTNASNGSPDLEQVLVQFLRRQEGLTLVSIGNLKNEAETTLPGTAAASGAAPGAAAMRRSGMELRVSGPYNDLVRYVKTLETAMPYLRWGTMQLSNDKQKTVLTLQVYLVGVQQ